MKLQRTTLILLLLALGLGGFVYFYEIQGATQRQEVKANEQQIFSFEEEQVQSFIVNYKGQTLEFERGEESGKPIWRMNAPNKALANDAAVSYLMNLLVTGKSDRRLQASADQLPEYGLAQPLATVEVKLKDQTTRRLILGKPDFNRNFLYAQTDTAAKPADKNVDVLLVSTDFENAVNRSLSEWKQQPNDKLKSEQTNTNKPTPTNTK